MSYSDPDLIRNIEIKIRVNKYEFNDLVLANDLDGGQLRTNLRERSVSWAQGVLANAPAHIKARRSFGIVRPDGEIKYRFVA